MDKRFLLAALEQAKMGRGICAPNPSVGAVAVKNGEIIARAYHKGSGTAHAEVLVFEQLPQKLDDVSLYVTLEPCNHWGRTPPCVNAIIERGVREVIYAYRDPNPVVIVNDTPTILANHGIQSRFVALDEVDAFYESYRHWRITNKPFVTVKMTPVFGRSVLDFNLDEFTRQQRKKSDVILTSASYISDKSILFNNQSDKNKFQKDLAVVDINPSFLSRTISCGIAKKTHCFCREKPLAIYNSDVDYHHVSAKRLDQVLQEVISHLGGLGYHDVWVEADAYLIQVMHQMNLVDRTYIHASNITKYSELAIKNTARQVEYNTVDDNNMLCLEWGR